MLDFQSSSDRSQSSDLFHDEQIFQAFDSDCIGLKLGNNSLHELKKEDPNLQTDFINSSYMKINMIDPNTYVPTQFLIENQPSRVIYIRNLDSNKVTMKNLFNLFSNFGNVLKIIFVKPKQSSLVEFDEILQASQAKDYLNNLYYYKQRIKIFYSNYQSISVNDYNVFHHSIDARH